MALCRRLLEPVFFLFIISCKVVNAQTAFERVPSEHSGVRFFNSVPEHVANVVSNQYSWNGGGVGIIDINNDGLQDILFTGNLVDNKLYLNLGGLRFQDITESSGLSKQDSGWCTGVAIGDVNADGFLDIFIGRSLLANEALCTNLLYLNQGDDTFVESSDSWGLTESSFTASASFFDYDLDGDLDLFVTNSPRNSTTYQGNYTVSSSFGADGGADILYKNINNQGFVNVSLTAGVLNDIASGLGVCTKDFNGDGWPDIYVSNDHIHHDFLYINQKDGTFLEESSRFLRHQSLTSMGSDAGDINNDGFNDIFVTDMLPFEDYKRKTQNHITQDHFKQRVAAGFQKQYGRNTLQINQAGLGFSEIGQFANVHSTDWSFGNLIADFDNDGNKDVFVATSIRKDYLDSDLNFFTVDSVARFKKISYNKALIEVVENLPLVEKANFLFINQGEYKFTNVADSSGLELPINTNGVALSDLDNDGDWDLVLNNLDCEAIIYQNRAVEDFKANFVKIKVTPSDKHLFAVRLHQGLAFQYSEISAPKGFQSCSESNIIFGLGQRGEIDSIVFIYQNGVELSIPDVPSNSSVRSPANFNNDLSFSRPNNKRGYQNPYLRQSGYKQLSSKSSIATDEFKINPLSIRNGRSMTNESLVQKSSHVLVLDRHNSTVYSLHRAGSSGFEIHSVVTSFTDQEGNNARFIPFDLDSDNDLDLLVFKITPASMQLEYQALLINSGEDKFHEEPTFDPIKLNIICSFLKAQKSSAEHQILILTMLLENMSIEKLYEMMMRPESVSETLSGLKELLSCFQEVEEGQVNHLWVDLNNDSVDDLIVIAEWEKPRFFMFNENSIEERQLSKQLGDSLFGFWRTAIPIDFDHDGDLDIVLGNIGDNVPFTASPTEPVRLYLKDIDENGQIESIVTHYLDHSEVTLLGRDKFLDQCPSLKRKYFNYSLFAGASVVDLLDVFNREPPEIKYVTTTSSLLLENLGNFSFRIAKLPAEVNLSSLNTGLTYDFNHDGYEDLFLAGNDLRYTTEIGDLDASSGLVLLNKAERGFRAINLVDLKCLSEEIANCALVSDSIGNHIIVQTANSKYYSLTVEP